VFAGANILIYTTSENTTICRKELNGSSPSRPDLKTKLHPPPLKASQLYFSQESPQYVFVNYD
jgi:hypothetical protein